MTQQQPPAQAPAAPAAPQQVLDGSGSRSVWTMSCARQLQHHHRVEPRPHSFSRPTQMPLCTCATSATTTTTAGLWHRAASGSSRTHGAGLGPHVPCCRCGQTPRAAPFSSTGCGSSHQIGCRPAAALRVAQVGVAVEEQGCAFKQQGACQRMH